MIVEEDRAAAQDKPAIGIGGNRGGQAGDDPVEEDGTAGGEKEWPVVADPCPNLRQELCGQCHQPVDADKRLAGIRRRGGTLIGGHTGEAEGRTFGCEDDIQNLSRGFDAASAGAAGTELDHQAQRRQIRAGLPGIAQRHGEWCGIDEDVQFGVGIIGEQRGQPAGGGGAADLVGEDQPALTGLQQHGGLADIGHRRAPSAGGEQRGGQGSGHRRLGMRRDLDALALHIGHHRRDIAGKSLLIERDQRQRHRSIERLPALPADRLERQGRVARRKTADAVVDQDIGGVKVRHAVLPWPRQAQPVRDGRFHWRW